MDQRFAILCATVANFAGKVAKQNLEPADFFPTLDKIEREPQSIEEQQMRCRAIAAALGQAIPAPLKAIPS